MDGFTVGQNSYGKAGVRVVTVSRRAGRHALRDRTVQVQLEGDFERAHTEGDNSLVVATDTMKNVCYALAKDHLDDAAETYGIALARHFLQFEPVSRATASIAEHRWTRLDSDGDASDHAFRKTADFTRTAVVAATPDGVTVEAGIDSLAVLKTTNSAFAGFPRDRYTTLPETDDRVLATKMTATWRYGRTDIDFEVVHAGVVATLLEVFAGHVSPSVQNSAWLMGRAVLEHHGAVEEIRFSLPNLHHWLADLAPFGLTNEQEVYVATSDPHGLIELTVART